MQACREGDKRFITSKFYNSKLIDKVLSCFKLVKHVVIGKMSQFMVYKGI